MTIASFLRFRKGDTAPAGLPDVDHEDLFPGADGKWYRRGDDGIAHLLEGVAGPAVSVAGDVATFADTTGALLADSGKAHSIDGTLAANSDALVPTQKAVKTYADTKASLASPTFTGDPKAPTAAVNDSDTSIATTAFVNAEIANDAPNVTLGAVGAVPNANAASLAAQVLTLQPSSASFPGVESVSNFKKQRDEYTDPFNDLGADPTGGVDASSILTTWIGTLGSGGGVLYLPANTRLRVDGVVAFNKDNVRVVGGSRRSSIIACGNATNTQFDVTGDACVFENLRFEAGTTVQNLALRSAGFCVDIDATSNGSGMYRCDVIGHWSAFNLEGQLPFVVDCSIREYGALATAGQCIRVNTPVAGGDTIISRVLTDNGSNIANWAGVRVLSCASLNIVDCNFIHTTVGLAVEPPNAGTISSIKCLNTYFDTGTHGVRFNPTGSGVWYRSEFTQCWMGSNTVAGVLFVNAQFDGIVFNNCDILGNPVGIDANAGGGSWTVTGGTQIAGSSTAGIRVAPSAGHFPVIQNCRIRPQAVGGAFGVNAVGIIVGVGTYLGLVIDSNDVSGNTSPLTLGVVTVADFKNYRITDNTAINPRNAVVGPPAATPVLATTYTNIYGCRVFLMVKTGITANTSFTINGVVNTMTVAPAAAILTFVLEPGGSWAVGGGTAPTAWVWNGQ